MSLQCYRICGGGGGGGGGGGVFLASEDSGGRSDELFPACVFFFLSRDQLAHSNSTF